MKKLDKHISLLHQDAKLNFDDNVNTFTVVIKYIVQFVPKNVETVQFGSEMNTTKLFLANALKNSFKSIDNRIKATTNTLMHTVHNMQEFVVKNIKNDVTKIELN